VFKKAEVAFKRQLKYRTGPKLTSILNKILEIKKQTDYFDDEYVKEALGEDDCLE